MARRRITTKSLDITVDLDGVEYALKSLPLDGPLRKQINQLVKDYCEPYVPFETGELSGNVSVTENSITYNAPYARYQYYGRVYGPNYWVPINEDGNGNWDKNGEWGWRSPEGETKHPTGARIEYNPQFHPLATSEWDKVMMADRGDSFTEAVADIVRPVVAHRARVASARALNW